jgi:hypothetical protein
MRLGTVLPRRRRSTEPRRWGERHTRWESGRTEARRWTWHSWWRELHRGSRKGRRTRCRSQKDASEQRSFPIESSRDDTYREASFPFRAQPAYRDLGRQEAERHKESEMANFFFGKWKKKCTNHILLVVVLYWRRALYG